MNARRAAMAVVCLLAASLAVQAQQRVDPLNMYERVWAIVPMIGKGTLADPKRPLYAPAPSEMSPTAKGGIAGWTFVASDDGNFALVEFVARDRSPFTTMLADSTVQAFLLSRDGKPTALTAFQKFKKNFDFSHFGVRVP